MIRADVKLRCIVSESANTQVYNIIIASEVKRLHRDTSNLHTSSLLPSSLTLVEKLQIIRNSSKETPGSHWCKEKQKGRSCFGIKMATKVEKTVIKRIKQPIAHQSGTASSGTVWPRSATSILFLFLVTHSSFRRRSTALAVQLCTSVDSLVQQPPTVFGDRTARLENRFHI